MRDLELQLVLQATLQKMNPKIILINLDAYQNNESRLFNMEIQISECLSIKISLQDLPLDEKRAIQEATVRILDQLRIVNTRINTILGTEQIFDDMSDVGLIGSTSDCSTGRFGQLLAQSAYRNQYKHKFENDDRKCIYCGKTWDEINQNE